MLQILNPDCCKFMADAGITEAELNLAADRIHCFSISRDFNRLTYASWVSDSRLILVDNNITKTAEIEGRLLIELVEPFLVLALKPDLPASRITRAHNIDELLAFIAESFGVPVRCHSDEPFSRLYSGPWDGKREVERERMMVSHAYAICGSFEMDCQWAHRVYSIDLTKYLDWAKKTFAIP